MTRKLGFVFLLVAVIALAATGAQANLILNPSFENGTSIPASPGFIPVPPNTINWWASDLLSPVHYVSSDYYAASDGYRSVDLNVDAAPRGWIRQTVRGLTPGATYYVAFDMVGIWDDVYNTGGGLKTLDVEIDNVKVYDATYDPLPTQTQANITAADWVTHTFTFVADADGAAILKFLSTTDQFAGPGIDNVRMDVVPLPGAVLLLGAGMARLVAYARRKRD